MVEKYSFNLLNKFIPCNHVQYVQKLVWISIKMAHAFTNYDSDCHQIYWKQSI